jgi:hypothetical protein
VISAKVRQGEKKDIRHLNFNIKNAQTRIKSLNLKNPTAQKIMNIEEKEKTGEK